MPEEVAVVSLSPGTRRRIVIVAIVGVIALAHLIGPGRFLSEDARAWYASYFSDVAMPFAGYFLLYAAADRLPVLRRWWIRGLTGFVAPALAECAQGLGVPILGATFDVLDFGMYALGVGAALIVDRGVLRRRFAFWRTW